MEGMRWVHYRSEMTALSLFLFGSPEAMGLRKCRREVSFLRGWLSVSATSWDLCLTILPPLFHGHHLPPLYLNPTLVRTSLSIFWLITSTYVLYNWSQRLPFLPFLDMHILLPLYYLLLKNELLMPFSGPALVKMLPKDLHSFLSSWVSSSLMVGAAFYFPLCKLNDIGIQKFIFFKVETSAHPRGFTLCVCMG